VRSLLEASNASVGIESTVLHGDGSKGEMLMVQAGASKRPATIDTIERGQHFITIRAARSSACRQVDGRRGRGGHRRGGTHPRQHRHHDSAPGESPIIEGVAKRLHFPPEKVFVNIQRYGNTSAASIPIALCEAESSGRLRKATKSSSWHSAVGSRGERLFWSGSEHMTECAHSHHSNGLVERWKKSSKESARSSANSGAARGWHRRAG